MGLADFESLAGPLVCLAVLLAVMLFAGVVLAGGVNFATFETLLPVITGFAAVASFAGGAALLLRVPALAVDCADGVDLDAFATLPSSVSTAGSGMTVLGTAPAASATAFTFGR